MLLKDLANLIFYLSQEFEGTLIHTNKEIGRLPLKCRRFVEKIDQSDKFDVEENFYHTDYLVLDVAFLSFCFVVVKYVK